MALSVIGRWIRRYVRRLSVVLIETEKRERKRKYRKRKRRELDGWMGLKK